MAPGRPKGSSNKSNFHKAGGKRTGAGRPSTTQILVRGQTNLVHFISKQSNRPSEETASLSELLIPNTAVPNDIKKNQLILKTEVKVINHQKSV